MSKTEILSIRVQALNAFDKAWNEKAAFSLLIRKEWERYGYISVQPINMKRMF